MQWDRYITNGYSAGGYLICLWSTRQYGCHAFGIPRPAAMVPIYPFTSWKLKVGDGNFNPDIEVLDCSWEEAVSSAYEIS